MKCRNPEGDRFLAEATVWLTHLHGSGEKDPESHKQFGDWLKADPRHEDAFYRVTELWDMLPGAAEILPPTVCRSPAGAFSSETVQRFVSVCSLILIAALFVLTGPSVRPEMYGTAVGEQRTVQLEDGTRVTLNTNSAIEAVYNGADRRVILTHGEALFEVAHDKAHAFRVIHEGGMAQALGTSFVVRNDGGQSSVTLIEGSVAVQARGSSATGGQVVILTPGERATIRADAGIFLDQPDPLGIVAWKEGRILFDDVTLREAAHEINRYTSNSTVIIAPDVSSLRISGAFSTRDALDFSTAIAGLYDLDVLKGPRGEIRIQKINSEKMREIVR